MRTLFFVVGLLMAITSTAQSSIKTTTLIVRGNCEQCKERIENAADIKGVKKCIWNTETKTATIVFDTTKTSLPNIEKAIARAGHETAAQIADEKSYSKLPDCCKYKHSKCHKK